MDSKEQISPSRLANKIFTLRIKTGALNEAVKDQNWPEKRAQRREDEIRLWEESGTLRQDLVRDLTVFGSGDPIKGMYRLNQGYTRIGGGVLIIDLKTTAEELALDTETSPWYQTYKEVMGID